VEASPLFNPPLVSPVVKVEGEEILERGKAPLLPKLPLPLLREGGQGDRLLDNLTLFHFGCYLLNDRVNIQLGGVYGYVSGLLIERLTQF